MPQWELRKRPHIRWGAKPWSTGGLDTFVSTLLFNFMSKQNTAHTHTLKTGNTRRNKNNYEQGTGNVLGTVKMWGPTLEPWTIKAGSTIPIWDDRGSRSYPNGHIMIYLTNTILVDSSEFQRDNHLTERFCGPPKRPPEGWQHQNTGSLSQQAHTKIASKVTICNFYLASRVTKNGRSKIAMKIVNNFNLYSTLAYYRFLDFWMRNNDCSKNVGNYCLKPFKHIFLIGGFSCCFFFVFEAFQCKQ